MIFILIYSDSILFISDAQRMKYPEHEHYRCGTACQKSCESIKRAPRLCSTQCIYGCFCNRGYIRASDDETAGCIPKTDCPQQTPNRSFLVQ
ncbi:hypothetical protein AVEN_114573-1 [Araneus ventricosus]|uniref:TIL domain-containing protein n=1 Tax=Araneus ventricosus TaxID=182803 RepID=A0A4Y2WL43_ARAVE|nr:hypothetical protein AVEN_25105-1 [Araneus ventricosus]GBO37314.1 hypothetical protein AVEN_114573-1 [Araneus ventricosus]